MIVDSLEVKLLVDFYDFAAYNYLVSHLESFEITITSACTMSPITCTGTQQTYVLGDPLA